MAANSKLTWKHFPAGENGFFRAPVLISGAHEAVLIDGGFTLPDGKALVEAITASGKKLTTIYISQSDPDYYFSLAPIKAAFPEAKVIAALGHDRGHQRQRGKEAGDLGPAAQGERSADPGGHRDARSLRRPDPHTGGPHHRDRGCGGLANRRYIWVPSLNAIFGGVLVFAGVHVWTADTQGAEARAAWVKTLDAMAARKPAVVVPGHMAPECGNRCIGDPLYPRLSGGVRGRACQGR